MPPKAFLRLVFEPDDRAATPAAPLGGSAGTLEAFHWLTAYKDAELAAAPHVRASAVRLVTPVQATLRLVCDATAAFVSVESAGVVGAFSDGAFMLLPGQTRELEFVARAPFQLDAFVGGLSVRSLRDTY